MPDCNRIVTITAPLPGWKRFRHVRSHRTMDFNPSNFEHQDLMFYYEKNPDWIDVTDEYRDEFCEENRS